MHQIRIRISEYNADNYEFEVTFCSGKHNNFDLAGWLYKDADESWVGESSFSEESVMNKDRFGAACDLVGLFYEKLRSDEKFRARHYAQKREAKS